MNAKDMFELSGFKKRTFLNTGSQKIIEFHDKIGNNRVKFYEKEKKYKVDFLGFGALVDMRLHNAIHQQLKELGWL